MQKKTASALMQRQRNQGYACAFIPSRHPEQSEGSPYGGTILMYAFFLEIPRFARDDVNYSAQL